MRRQWKRWLLGVALLLIAIQFVRPERTNPAGDPAQTLQASLPVSPEVEAILNRSCSDCHSDRTVWPWYSGLAPASWLVISDVNEGRGKLNFSRWTSYKAERQGRLLDKMCQEVTKGDMPLSQYILIHRGAKLRGQDAQVICGWTKMARSRLGSATQNQTGRQN